MLEPHIIDQALPENPRPGDYALAAGLAVIGGALLTGLTLFVDAVPGHHLVLGPPGADAAGIAYAAGGLLVSTTGWPNLVVADAGGLADFRDALRAQGAWLVLPAPSAGCLAR